MAEINLKAFSFCDFFEEDWSHFRSRQRDLSLANLFEMAAFTGISGKEPPDLDEDDRNFLLQFPPEIWTDALMWRYNGALRLAHKERMAGGDQKKMIALDHQIQDTMPTLTLRDQSGSYTFSNVWTGMKKLVHKLEAPVHWTKNDTNMRGNEKGDKRGILDFDPDDKEAIADYYKNGYGVLNYDLTNYVHDPGPRGLHTFAGMSVMQKESATKAIAKWIKLMGLRTADNKPILGSVGPEVVDPFTKEPLPVQHDLLPSEIRPPRTKGHGSVWQNYDTVGRDTFETDKGPVVGKKETIRIPAITRKISYVWRSRSGKEQKVHTDRPVKMPYLLPAHMLPRIKITPEQQEALQARRENATENQRGTKIEKDKKSKIGGQLQDTLIMINNWDLLTPEQKQVIQENPRNSFHRLRYQKDDAYKARNVPYTSVNDTNVGVGWDPNKQQKTNAAVFQKGEPMDPKLYNDYLKKTPGLAVKLYQEATDGVVWWMIENLGYDGSTDIGSAEAALSAAAIKSIKTAVGSHKKSARKGQGRGPDSQTDRTGKLNMMRADIEDIIGVAFALIASKLNDPLMGIYDPEHGFSARNPDVDDEKASRKRVNYAKTFARDTSQKALTALNRSRRQIRQGIAGGVSKSLSDKAGEGDDAQEIGANLEKNPNQTSGGGGLWDTRAGVGGFARRNEKVSSNQWLIQGAGHLSTFFATRRKDIMMDLELGAVAQTLGHNPIDTIGRKMEIAMVATALCEKFAKEIQKTQKEPVLLDDPRVKQKASEALDSPPYDQNSDEFIGLLKWEIKGIVDSAKEGDEISKKAVDAQRLAGASDKWKRELLSRLRGPDSFGIYIPRNAKDPEDYINFTIGQDPGEGGRDLAKIPAKLVIDSIIAFIYSDSDLSLDMGVDAVNRYAVPLIVKILKAKGLTPNVQDVALAVANIKGFADTFHPDQLAKPYALPAAASDVSAGISPAKDAGSPGEAPGAVKTPVRGDPAFVSRLADLSQWPSLVNDPGFAANAEAVRTAHDKLWQDINTKTFARQHPSNVERTAAIAVGAALKKLGNQ